MPTYDFKCAVCGGTKTSNVKYEDRSTQLCNICGGLMLVDYSTLRPALKNVQ